jgi:hypothetical protein
MGKIKSYIVFESNSLSDEDIKNQLDELYDQKSKIESKIHTLNKEISKRKTDIANTISKTIPKNHQKWSSENWNWILIHSHYDTEFEYRFRTNLLQSNFDKLYFSGLSPETNQFRFSIHFRDNEDKSQVKNIVKQSYLLIRHLTPYEINKNAIVERCNGTIARLLQKIRVATENNRWYEVQSLSEDRVFIPDTTKITDNAGIRPGRYLETDLRFITEFTPENFMKMTFGGANSTANDQLRLFAQTGIIPRLNDYQNNINLGLIPRPNTTLFIQYRVGGGLESNVGVNTITSVGNVDFVTNGSSPEIVNRVLNSIQCTNVTAAVGGNNPPTIEEIRNYVTFNFSSQNRAVTINDYYSLINKMPGIYGVPAKVGVLELNNKINVLVLSQDASGKMTQNVPQILKDNISLYLSNYRMMNDYIQVQTGKVIDLAFEIYVTLQKTTNQNSIIADIIDKVDGYMIPQAREFGQDVIISDIRRIVQAIEGVVSVSDIKVFNRVGGQYSSSQTAQVYSDPTTKQIQLIDDTIFAQPTEFYQIRFANRDIGVRVKQ